MSRQIKDEIFKRSGELEQQDIAVEGFLSDNEKSTRIAKTLRSSGTSLSVDFTDLQVLATKMDQIRKDMLDVTNNVKSLDSALSSTIDTSDNRFERVKSALVTIDKQFKHSIHDIHQRLADLSSKVVNRKMNEEKIEQMLTRHNNMIQNFEHKFNNMQKVITEQEIQLSHSRAALKDALNHIERLKRL